VDINVLHIAPAAPVAGDSHLQVEPHELLEDTQVQHIPPAAPVAGDRHLQEEKTATTGTLTGYPGTAHCSCGGGQPSSRRENSNHRES
jgi:hypothetical protein